MEMVAASKMRKAQERMAVGKPYARRMRAVVGHIANAAPEYQHMYMKERAVKRVGYIIVSSDRGLCGGLNGNLVQGHYPVDERVGRPGYRDRIEPHWCQGSSILWQLWRQHLCSGA